MSGLQPPPAAAETRMVEVVSAENLNYQGDLFGGEALRMMDTTAFVAATRRARRTLVTVSVTDVEYLAPVRCGEIVELIATVARVGRTSIAIDVEMVSEARLSGERRACGHGRFVFVAVDEEGRPVPVDGDG